ncbi:P-loop containing nucleoside triphosphate hydrolase protein [Peziza echinospora]|nr:P-loop containing nucleoside triphosphate hydrolase protein [Peziza echinospora]
MPPKKSKKPADPPPPPPPAPSGSNKNTRGGGGGGGGGGSGPSGNTSASGNASAQAPGHLTPDQLAREAAQAQARATRVLVAGPSWTGKLPVNLLSEHCQKSGWEKPDFRTPKSPNGFYPTVWLRYKNSRTGTVEEVQFAPPNEFAVEDEDGDEAVKTPHMPTVVEAKHLGATYALYRVSSMKNVQFMLPPRFQAWWKIFETVKKADVKAGKAWMYEADPFVVKRERQVIMDKAQKDREKRNAAAAVEGGPSAPLQEDRAEQRKMAMKGWQNVPVVEMAKDVRKMVEELVRKYHAWNPAEVEIKGEAKHHTIEELVGLGFRRSHVEEACEWAGDREECLEWLLVHVPEDDLPPRFLPDKYTVGVTITGGDVILSQQYAADRLCAAGYSLELCREALQRHKGNEGLAAEDLMHRLLPNSTDKAPIFEQDLLSYEDGDPWEEEMSMLESIWGQTAGDDDQKDGSYEPRFRRISKDVSQVLLELDDPPKSGAERAQIPPKLYLVARRPATNYPIHIPVISIATASAADPKAPKTSQLPAHIRLSIIRQAAQYALETLRGEQMVFAIADWLGSNIANIIFHPGKLRDVSSAITQLETPALTQTPVTKKNRKNTSGPMRHINWNEITPAGKSLYEAWLQKHSPPSPKFAKMLAGRKTLPAWSKRDDIVNAITNCPVTIITGETGSGKSTQAVQFILDHLLENKVGDKVNILCTQPRRISALGLADRVAEERAGVVGAEIGYVIRGDSKSRRGVTKITFVTTGVLLRRMQMSGSSSSEIAADDTEDVSGDWAGLEGVSHVFVDEVHERSLDTDFLLVLLKRAMTVRKDLKVVLMSATVDAATFADYFGGADKVAQVEIEGRTFPVEEYYLDQIIKKTNFDVASFSGGGGGGYRGKHSEKKSEAKSDSPSSSATDLEATPKETRDPYIDAAIRSMGDRINYALIGQLVHAIDADLMASAHTTGGILIFLPGTLEIQRTLDAVNRLPGASERFHILPLHASLPASSQRLVFPPAPAGKRKVIATTNVAETSITIEDIVAVIDTGRVKETSYSIEKDMVCLDETWASRAACKQRKGRAGRVRAGQCYKLYTRAVERGKMVERPEPELLRVPLQQTCLGVKSMGIKDVRKFLASALSPPDVGAVEGALDGLLKMGALKDEELTALGRHMAMIPADLKCSKLLVYGAIFGCLDTTLTIAAVLSTKSPFFSPMDKRDEAKAARAKFGDPQGDVLCDTFAHMQWSAMRNTQSTRDVKMWCDENFLSHHVLLDISSTKAQLLSSLKEVGLVPYSYNFQPSPFAPTISNTPSDDELSDPIMSLNRNAANPALLRTLIGAAFTPHISRIEFPEKRFTQLSSGAIEVDPEARQIKFFTPGGSVGGNIRVFVHPSSTLFGAKGFVGNAGFVSYFNKMGTGGANAPQAKDPKQQGQFGGGGGGGKVYIREITPVGLYALLLLGGELRVDTMGRGMTVDGWLRIRGWGRIGVLVGMMRRLLDGVVRDKVEFPLREEGGGGGGVDARREERRRVEREVVRVLGRLVEGDGH